MTRSLRRIALAALVFALAIAIAAFASAQPDDRAAAESILKELEASPKKDVAQEMIGRAKTALDRGARMRSAGDEAHARVADKVARTWAEAARDIVKYIKDKKIKKVQASIQGDQVRVTSPSKDELQDAMRALREHDFGVALQFGNYR